MEYRYATEADAPAMAQLFAAAHHDSLTPQQRADQGFVQGNLDEAALRGMAGNRSLLLADQDGQLAGFLALSAPADLAAASAPIRALLQAQDSLTWHGRPLSETRWLMYGPVLVDPAQRGRGVARGLFTMAVEAASGRADALVAFIEAGNKPSWTVHVDGFGMTPLGEIAAADRGYHVVAAAVPPSKG
ncbi:GNAT family N-acetyltransferase [Streptacidiphilus sp. PAMC 29251]